MVSETSQQQGVEKPKLLSILDETDFKTIRCSPDKRVSQMKTMIKSQLQFNATMSSIYFHFGAKASECQPSV